MQQIDEARRFNGVFRDETLDVTGAHAFNGTFINCVLHRRPTLAGEPKTELWQAYYLDCQLIGDGWPEGWTQTAA